MSTIETERQCTWVGSYGYWFSPRELKLIRQMAKLARTDWRFIAARPELGADWIREAGDARGNLDVALERIRIRAARGC